MITQIEPLSTTILQPFDDMSSTCRIGNVKESKGINKNMILELFRFNSRIHFIQDKEAMNDN